ncbi:hypothetical protein [Variovorax sp. GB1P17]|uniref:hypothetical protein n=1 Tax=Variovorax sp. GB1P17 TaxID=3443740 RepID=UPI003F4650EC
MPTPTPIDPIREALPVVAWAYYDGERESFPSGPWATLCRSTLLSFNQQEHSRNETPLCRLSDAEAALKAKDTEIEALKAVMHDVLTDSIDPEGESFLSDALYSRAHAVLKEPS